MTPVYSVLIVIGIFLASCAASLFRRQWNDLNACVYHLLFDPLSIVQGELVTFWIKVRQFFRKQLEDRQGQLDLRGIFFDITGACFYSFFFFLFLFADFHLMALTFEAMGIESTYVELPVETGTLAVIALISEALFFGSMILDMNGMTRLAPWRENLTPVWQRVVFGICVLSLSLCLVVAGLCGQFRGEALSEPEVSWESIEGYSNTGLSINGNIELLEPPKPESPRDSGTDRILIFVNVAIPILFMIGSVFSGYGIVAAFKFLLLGVIFLALLPSGALLVLAFITNVLLNQIFHLTNLIINFFALMGNWFFSLIGYTPNIQPLEPLEPLQGSSPDGAAPPEVDEPQGHTPAQEPPQAPEDPQQDPEETCDAENQQQQGIYSTVIELNTREGFNPYQKKGEDNV